MISCFHHPPDGYFYEYKEFKRGVISIWIVHNYLFTYNGGDQIRCIWGFYNVKTKTYHAPINSTKCGDSVNILNTTPYSAMQSKLSPLELAFV
jgi:hypothetical protein